MQERKVRLCSVQTRLLAASICMPTPFTLLMQALTPQVMKALEACLRHSDPVNTSLPTPKATRLTLPCAAIAPIPHTATRLTLLMQALTPQVITALEPALRHADTSSSILPSSNSHFPSHIPPHVSHCRRRR